MAVEGEEENETRFVVGGFEAERRKVMELLDGWGWESR